MQLVANKTCNLKEYYVNILIVAGWMRIASTM